MSEYPLEETHPVVFYELRLCRCLRFRTSGQGTFSLGLSHLKFIPIDD